MVNDYFSTGDSGGLKEGRIWFLYGRMRAKGELIPEAEAILEDERKRRMLRYREEKEKELQYNLLSYEREYGEVGEYEVMKINDRSNGRTLVIGIMATDIQKGKIIRTHVIEISEFMDPEYFKECMMRYAPGRALSSDKPF